MQNWRWATSCIFSLFLLPLFFFAHPFEDNSRNELYNYFNPKSALRSIPRACREAQSPKARSLYTYGLEAEIERGYKNSHCNAVSSCGRSQKSVYDARLHNRHTTAMEFRRAILRDRVHFWHKTSSTEIVPPERPLKSQPSTEMNPVQREKCVISLQRRNRTCAFKI